MRRFSHPHASQSKQTLPSLTSRFRPQLEELEPRALPSGDFFVVPGTPGTTTAVHFDWTVRDAAFFNEVGIYQVDNARGDVGGVAPGSARYAQAVLNNGTRQTIFDSGTGVGTQRTITLSAGARFAFYLIQDATSATFLAHNPLNKLGHGPLAFFSVDRGNPDGANHELQTRLDGKTVRFAWEDGTGGGDADFNDVVFTAHSVPLSPPVPQVFTPQRALAIPGQATQSVPTTFHLNVRDAAFHNELGIFAVDDGSGRIGNLHPGDPGYDIAALSRRQIVFSAGQGAGAKRTLNLSGGFFGIYLIQDGTSAEFLRHNSRDRLGHGPLAFFSFFGGNPDDFDHMRQVGDREFAFEDGTFGGDHDFNDAIVSISFGTPGQTPTGPPKIQARLAHDTGTSSSDGLTNDPTVTGTVSDPPGGIVSFRAGFDNTPPSGFAIVTDTLLSSGSFTLDPNRLRAINGGTLPDGPHTLHLQATDARGEVTSFDLSFTLDTTAPLLTFDLDPATDTDPVGDHRTTSATATLLAVSEANVTVTLLATGQSRLTTSAGNASFANVNLASGPNDFFMTATDAAGNTTTAEQVITRNDAPVVTTPLADVTVAQNSPPTVINNLLDNFTDPNMVNSVVRFDTSLGRFDVELFDQTTPGGQPLPATTVANFLNYVNGGDYDNTIVHRSVRVSDAGVDVIQGGGFALNISGFLDTTHIQTNPAIADEPAISNTRGTIAMAKSGPNTATSEWFINDINNTVLDNPAQPSGAFTVFGQVTGSGMQVVDAIAAVPTFHFSGAFANIPLRNFTDTAHFPQSATADKVVAVNPSLFNRRDILTFTITGNDNSGLVTPNINGNQLTLTYTQNTTGTAHITVQATDLDGASVQSTFTVTVAP
jgi:cyclophilin family peptidyl-prolyl cis-trans isomerase